MRPGPSFAVERHERIDASAATTLVRVRGRWSAQPAVDLAAPQLELVAGGAMHRYAPLPDPTSAPLVATPDGADWRAAYPVPAQIADRATKLALRVAEAEPAVLFEAPHPAEPAITERDDLQQALEHAVPETRPVRAEIDDQARASARAERQYDADRAAGAEARVEAVERESAELRAALDGKSTLRASADGPLTVELEWRIAQLEAELEASRRLSGELADRLLESQRQVDETLARLRGEAEARDQAEARAAGQGRTPGPAVEPAAAPAPGERAQVDEAVVSARMELLELDARKARAEADRLSGELLEARGALDEAATRLQEETEARMRAEARAGGGPG